MSGILPTILKMRDSFPRLRDSERRRREIALKSCDAFGQHALKDLTPPVLSKRLNKIWQELRKTRDGSSIGALVSKRQNISTINELDRGITRGRRRIDGIV